MSEQQFNEQNEISLVWTTETCCVDQILGMTEYFSSKRHENSILET